MLHFIEPSIVDEESVTNANELFNGGAKVQKRSIAYKDPSHRAVMVCVWIPQQVAAADP